MTLWELSCAMAGFRALHPVKEKAPSMEDDRLAELGIEGFF